jgi:aminoglycoside phosphotransferase
MGTSIAFELERDLRTAIIRNSHAQDHDGKRGNQETPSWGSMTPRGCPNSCWTDGMVAPSIPDELAPQLRGYNFRLDAVGQSGNSVYRLDASHCPPLIAKIFERTTFDLANQEAARLAGLRRAGMSAPRTLSVARTTTHDWLLMECLLGGNAAISSDERMNKVQLMADALAKLHALPIETCPFDETLSTKLARAQANVCDGIVDELDFDDDHLGLSAQQLFEELKALRLVIHRIRRHWPNVRILIRGDSHYCATEVLDLLRRLRCDYILGLPINVKLDAIAKPWREQCERRREAGRSRKVRRMHQLTYQAGSWSRAEKVIARVEATEMGSDARFVVTSLSGRGKVLYEKVYCARGRMENLIKDMKLYTRSDKTACSRWQANQFRLFLHMGAYWLLHSVRLAAPKRSRWRGATFATIRAVFAKIACRVEELKTRIKLSFPAHLLHADALATITTRLRAQGP